MYTKAVSDVRGLAAVHRCYTVGDSDFYAKFSGGSNVVVA